MAINAAHWTVDRDTKNIRYVGNDHDGGSPSYATVIEFHRWLQDLADDAVATASTNDELDITEINPSVRSTDNIITLINGYNIDDTAAEHLYDGSIIQTPAGGEEIYDGIVNFGNSDVQIQIHQDGAVLADDWWNQGGAGLNADSNAGISHRFMIKVRTGGSDIDGRRLLGTCRRFGYTYAEFPINGTARGNNVFALSDSDDINNNTGLLTVSGFIGITNSNEGYSAIDVNNDGTVEYYYSEWDANKGTRTINEFYERMKYITRDGSAETMYDISGELFRGITHEIPLDTYTGTFTEPERLEWVEGTTLSAGQLLAISDVDGPSGTVWLQLLKGIAPTDGTFLSGVTSLATAAVNGSVTDRSAEVKTPFVGQSTGAALIGAYGLGLETNDLTNNDTLFDLTNTQRTPPNNVTNTVGSLAVGDYVIVATRSGLATDVNGDPAIWKDYLTLGSGLTTNNVEAVYIEEQIPGDTPANGTIRVTDDTGLDRRLVYSSYSDNLFIIDSGLSYPYGDFDGTADKENATAGNGVYITYIDKEAEATSESYTGVYDTSRNLTVVVRDGGGTPIKQFVSAWTFSSTDATLNAIRTTDA